MEEIPAVIIGVIILSSGLRGTLDSMLGGVVVDAICRNGAARVRERKKERKLLHKNSGERGGKITNKHKPEYNPCRQQNHNRNLREVILDHDQGSKCYKH